MMEKEKGERMRVCEGQKTFRNQFSPLVTREGSNLGPLGPHGQQDPVSIESFRQSLDHCRFPLSLASSFLFKAILLTHQVEM